VDAKSPPEVEFSGAQQEVAGPVGAVESPGSIDKRAHVRRCRSAQRR